MPDNKETRKEVAKAAEKLRRAKEWGIGEANAREELKEANKKFLRKD